MNNIKSDLNIDDELKYDLVEEIFTKPKYVNPMKALQKENTQLERSRFFLSLMVFFLAIQNIILAIYVIGLLMVNRVLL